MTKFIFMKTKLSRKHFIVFLSILGSIMKGDYINLWDIDHQLTFTFEIFFIKCLTQKVRYWFWTKKMKEGN